MPRNSTQKQLRVPLVAPSPSESASPSTATSVTTSTKATSALSPLSSATPIEDIPTPNPHPSRALFGFVIYIIGWLFIPIYLIWLWVPTCILEEYGITYVPAKFWAVALPLLLPVLIVLYVFGVFLRNGVIFRGIFDTVEEVTHDFKDE